MLLHTYETVLPGFFKKKWANPGLFFIYFRSFQTNNVKNVQMTIQYMAHGFKPATLHPRVITHNHKTRAPAQQFYLLGLVVVAQLVQWILPKPKICCLNPDIGKFYFLSSCIEKMKMKGKEANRVFKIERGRHRDK